MKRIIVAVALVFALAAACHAQGISTQLYTYTGTQQVNNAAWPVYIPFDCSIPHNYHIVNIGKTTVYLTTTAENTNYSESLGYLFLTLLPGQTVDLKNINVGLWSSCAVGQKGLITYVAQIDTQS